MDLNEARELRKELEAIEATMGRIRALWLSDDFPAPHDLEELASALGGISSTLEEIPAKVKALPNADDFDELATALGGINGILEEIPSKVEQLPTADDLR